jgi:hypothetical protein
VTVSYTAEGITRVRVRALALDLVNGKPAQSPGAVEVTWSSDHAGLWHQVYVRGQLAGVTARPGDRRLIVAAPTGGRGASVVVPVEVVAVDAADRWADLGGRLGGFGANRGARVRLTWQAGEYLDPDLTSFAVFADGRTGRVDYGTPLTATPIPARPDGLAPWGYGCGGYGLGGCGRSAACYAWVTDPLEPGPWRFAVIAIDAAGNRLATAAETTANVRPLPRPAEDVRIKAYDSATRTATLTWTASPDV